MAVVLVDGSAVRRFALDEKAFSIATDSRFEQLDVNKDGVLSKTELFADLYRLCLLETHLGVPISKSDDELNKIYDSAFNTFDADGNGLIDKKEFREQMRQMMFAIADGIGTLPIELILEDHSLLKDVVDYDKI